MSAVDLLEAINGGDVRMIQRGEEVCFALKPGNPVRIVDEAVRDHLEGDVTIESRITRSVHLAHPAGPDGGDDLVGAEARAGGERHSFALDYTSRTAVRSGLLLINGVVAIWEARGAVTRHCPTREE
jgi:hypothetical protein